MDADFLLLHQMKSGDGGAVDRFVRKHYPAILRYCRLHVGDLSYAEDLTQDTFERFFRTLDRCRPYGKASSYLYAIAANACRDFYRREAAHPAAALDENAAALPDGADDRLDLERALARLPDELREVAILFFCQERRQQEIAQILNIGLPLVKYRVRRARELLAADLGKEDAR